MLEILVLSLALTGFSPPLEPAWTTATNAAQEPLVAAAHKKKRTKRKKNKVHKKRKKAAKKTATAKPAVGAKTEPAADATAESKAELAPLVGVADSPPEQTDQASTTTSTDNTSTPSALATEPAAATVEHEKKTEDTEPRDVELRLRKLADELAKTAASKGQDPRYQRFALLPFEATDAETKEKGLGLVVTDVIGTSLVRDHGFALVERTRLKAVLDEMALQQSGITDDESTVELGKIANADILIVGQIALLGDQYQVTAKLISTESAQVLGVASTQLPNADLISLSSHAVVLRSRSDAAFRSAVLPGWGQHYNREPTKGWIFTGLIGTLLAAGVGFEGAGLTTHMLYYLPYQPDASGLTEDGLSPGDPQFAQNLADRKSLATTQLYVGHILLGTTVALWAYNVVDAYLSGVDGSEMIGAGGD